MEEHMQHWSEEERRLLEEFLEPDPTGIVLNMSEDGPHRNLVPWIMEHHPERFMRGDRRPWRNPFVLGQDGDRGEIADKFARHYLPHKTKLCATLAKPEMSLVAWGCWCAPEPCHCGALLHYAQWEGMDVSEWFRRRDKAEKARQKELEREEARAWQKQQEEA